MYKNILIPLDTSELAECTVTHAEAIAKGLHSPSIVLLNVVAKVHQGWVADWSVPEDWIRKAEDKDVKFARYYLDTLANSLKEESLEAEAVVVTGEPAEEILNYINKNAVDLVVMSSHGRSGVSRWLLGSVADITSPTASAWNNADLITPVTSLISDEAFAICAHRTGIGFGYNSTGDRFRPSTA